MSKLFAYRAEILAAGGWVDVTPDVRGALSNTRGRSGEGYRADPGKCGFRLDNRTGRYSPRNPASDLYGLIGRNTPVRVRAQITGDAFARTVSNQWGSVDAYTGPAYAWSTFGAGAGTVLAADWSVSGGMGRMSVPAAGAYRVSWLSTLSLADAVVTVTSGATLAAVTGGPIEPVAVLLRMQSMSTYYMARVEVSASEAVTLALYGPSGALASVPVPSITWTGQPLRLSAAIVGDQLAAVVWDAAGAEPAAWQVQAPATDLTPGAIGLRAGIGLGNTDTKPVLFAFDDLFIGVGRFYGEIPSWPPRWSLSGKDRYVDVDAAGLLGRFRQGDQPARSPLRRTIEATGPLAYWPGEDGISAGQAASAVPRQPPLIVSGPSLEFRKVDDFQDPFDTIRYGTSALADLSTGSKLRATPLVSAATVSAWTVGIAAGGLDPVNISGDVDLLEWTTPGGTFVKWRLRYLKAATRVQVLGYTAAGTEFLFCEKIGTNIGFGPRYVSGYQVGGNLTIDLYETASDIPDETFTAGGTLGGIAGSITVNSSGASSTVPMPAGHVAIWETDAPPSSLISDDDSYGELVYAPWASWHNEAATDRLVRVAAEVGVTVDTTAADVQHVSRMGPQPTASTTALLDESVAVDGGLLFEARDALALAYRTRGDLYNQTPVAIAYTGQTTAPFDPDDETDVRNDVTVERVNGSSARAVRVTGPLAAAEPPDGVGIYTDTPKLNLDTDAPLPDQAGWRLHLGTVDEPRYPAISVQLASPEWVAAPALRTQLLALDVGGVLEVTGPPAWVSGRVRMLVTGYTETISEYLWSITFNGVPASPWDVAEEGGAQRVAVDGATLNAGVTTTATTLSLATTGGNLFTTKASAFPLDLLVGGAEQVRVSAITGTSSPQTATVSARSVNGVVKAWAAGTSVDVWAPAVAAL